MAITKIGTTGISNNLDVPGYLYLSGDNKELRFYNGANYMILKASGSLSNNYTITLPVDDGTSGQFLKTDGGGVLSWDAAGGPTEATQAVLEETASGKSSPGSSTANTYISPEVAHFHPGVAKAWIDIPANASITPAAANSYGVASVTNTATGDRTITWAVAFSNTTYSVVGTCADVENAFIKNVLATGSVRHLVVTVASSPALVNARTSTAAFGDH